MAFYTGMNFLVLNFRRPPSSLTARLHRFRMVLEPGVNCPRTVKNGTDPLRTRPPLLGGLYRSIAVLSSSMGFASMELFHRKYPHVEHVATYCTCNF